MVTVYIIYFFLLSAAGYVYETLAMTVWGGKWDNRGFLYGPVIPIYGAGALGGTLLFEYLIQEHNPLLVFCISVVVSAILEYVVHYVLEKLFHQVWWDYSMSVWNINGRICLPASVGFGIAGLLIIYVINPMILPTIEGIDSSARLILSVILCAVFVLDIILTLARLKGKEHSVEQKYQKLNETMDTAVGKVLDESMALNKRVYVIFDKIDHGNRVGKEQ